MQIEGERQSRMSVLEILLDESTTSLSMWVRSEPFPKPHEVKQQTQHMTSLSGQGYMGNRKFILCKLQGNNDTT